jgi:hypothetical protein
LIVSWPSPTDLQKKSATWNEKMLIKRWQKVLFLQRHKSHIYLITLIFACRFTLSNCTRDTYLLSKHTTSLAHNIALLNGITYCTSSLFLL